MKHLFITLLFFLSVSYAQLDTVTFTCSDGSEHFFTAVPVCTEVDGSTTVKNYWMANPDNTISIYCVIMIGGKVNQFNQFTFSPKIVHETVDFETKSFWEEGKTVKKLMITHYPASDAEKGVTETGYRTCVYNTEPISEKRASVIMYFDNTDRYNDFIAVLNALKDL